MQLGEVLPAENLRHRLEIVSRDVQELQVLEIHKRVRQGHEAVGAYAQPLEIGKLADMLPRIQVLEEGVCIAEEDKLLSGSQILHLERQALLGVK